VVASLKVEQAASLLQLEKLLEWLVRIKYFLFVYLRLIHEQSAGTLVVGLATKNKVCRRLATNRRLVLRHQEQGRCRREFRAKVNRALEKPNGKSCAAAFAH
jgi:hypothetical protein